MLAATPRSVLVTGANKGISSEIVRQVGHTRSCAARRERSEAVCHASARAAPPCHLVIVGVNA